MVQLRCNSFAVSKLDFANLPILLDIGEFALVDTDVLYTHEEIYNILRDLRINILALMNDYGDDPGSEFTFNELRDMVDKTIGEIKLWVI